jgi:L-amino acid N-acyltransferase YncA
MININPTGTGLGILVLSKITDFSKKAGIKRIVAVAENDNSARFFQRVGFVNAVKGHPTYVKPL